MDYRSNMNTVGNGNQTEKNVPAVSNPIWKNIILGKYDYSISFLAAKILAIRLKMKMNREGEKPEIISSCANEMRELYLLRGHLPDAKKDLEMFNSFPNAK